MCRRPENLGEHQERARPLEGRHLLAEELELPVTAFAPGALRGGYGRQEQQKGPRQRAEQGGREAPRGPAPPGAWDQTDHGSTPYFFSRLRI
jgi:hypothetical protein